MVGSPKLYKNTGMSTLQQNNSRFTSVSLFGDTSFDNNSITFITGATLDCIISTRIFDL